MILTKLQKDAISELTELLGSIGLNEDEELEYSETFMQEELTRLVQENTIDLNIKYKFQELIKVIKHLI